MNFIYVNFIFCESKLVHWENKEFIFLYMYLEVDVLIFVLKDCS